jgi:ABC-type transport system involved in multi-copper enzyme maturation permease subunit
MFALAIIERELRVRSRRLVTSWLRVGVGVAATVTAISNLNWMSRGFGAGAAGKQMFLMLAWMAFAFCLLEGARCAADVISREKREGTLGFLILTELSGFEVVLGKFAAVSVTSFYALLALYPAMALALPAGGLTAGEFWRTQAALLDTLFLAVAAGLWVSARSQDDTRALLGTIGLLSALVLLPAVIGLSPPFNEWLNPSPGVVLSMADASSYGLAPSRFWGSLILMHALAWALLIMAGRSISVSWRSESSESTGARQERQPEPAGFTIPPSLHSDPEQARRDLLEEQPARWFGQRRRESGGLIWLAVVMQPLLQLSITFVLPRISARVGIGGMLTAAYFAVWLTAQLILAVVAARRMAEERASGNLEVLLASPLSARQIVLGHWWGLWQWLRWPLLVSSVLTPVILGLIRYSQWPAGSTYFWLYQLASFLIYPSYLLAVCWLGMWMGVRTPVARACRQPDSALDRPGALRVAERVGSIAELPSTRQFWPTSAELDVRLHATPPLRRLDLFPGAHLLGSAPTPDQTPRSGLRQRANHCAGVENAIGGRSPVGHTPLCHEMAKTKDAAGVGYGIFVYDLRD